MKKISLIALLISLLSTSIFADGHVNEVNVFSARHYDSDIQLYQKFTSKTGIKVNVISGKSKASEKKPCEYRISAFVSIK